MKRIERTSFVSPKPTSTYYHTLCSLGIWSEATYFLLFFHYLSYTFFQKNRNTKMRITFNPLKVKMKTINYQRLNYEKIYNSSTQCEVSV